MEVRGGARFKSEEVERFILGARGGGERIYFLWGMGSIFCWIRKGCGEGGGYYSFYILIMGN